MERSYYLGLAAAGLRMPLAADLVLHEKDNPEAIVLSGDRLGRVVAETARRFGTPLAVPHMDLEMEKAALLASLGIAADALDTFKFQDRPNDVTARIITEHFDPHAHARLHAHIESVRWVARNTDLLAIGMAIGPFSLATKLVADPITPIYMAGSGATAAEDPEIALFERALDLALHVVQASVAAQIAAGARAVFIAEPAANRVYFSPKQLDKGSDIYERFALAPNRRVKKMLDASGVDLILHNCGELTDGMVKHLASLHPVILSLGSSRVLWEDAARVPDDVVLFGNLPSKRFYSDDLITTDDVTSQAQEVTRRMRETGHPFILGTECDVLSVPGHEATLMAKAQRLGAAHPTRESGI